MEEITLDQIDEVELTDIDVESTQNTITSTLDLVPEKGSSSSIIDRINLLGTELSKNPMFKASKEAAMSVFPAVRGADIALNVGTQLQKENLGTFTKEVGLALPKGGTNIFKTQAQGMNYLGRLLRVTDDKLKPLEDAGIIDPFKAKIARGISDGLINYGEKLTKYWKGEREFLQKYSDKDTWEGTFDDNFSITRLVASATESIPLMSVGAIGGAVTGSAWVGASLLGTAEGLDVFQEALDKGKSDTRALTVGAIAGATSTATEVIFGALTDILSPNATKVLNSVWKEATQEAGQQVLTNTIRKLGIDNTVSIFEGLTEAAMVGGLTGGMMTGIANTTKKQAIINAKEVLTPAEFDQITQVIENVMVDNGEGINKALEANIDEVVAFKDKQVEEQKTMAEQPQETVSRETLKDIPESERPLYEEALKYDSADEFVDKAFRKQDVTDVEAEKIFNRGGNEEFNIREQEESKLQPTGEYKFEKTGKYKIFDNNKGMSSYQKHNLTKEQAIKEIKQLEGIRLLNKNEEYKNTLLKQNSEEQITKKILFHGTSIDFKRFEREKLKSGEGVNAFGAGIYITDVPKVAEYYADKIGKIRSSVSSMKKRKYINNITGEEHIGSELFKEAQKEGIDFYDYVEDNFTAKYAKDKTNYDKYKTFKILKFKKENPIFLGWETIVPKEILQKSNVTEINITGKELYKILTEKTGSKENASAFLESKGIDGISYPTGTLSFIDAPFDGNNYVIFNPDNLEIVDTKKGSGTSYRFVDDILTNIYNKAQELKTQATTKYAVPQEAQAQVETNKENGIEQGKISDNDYKKAVEYMQTSTIGKLSISEKIADTGKSVFEFTDKSFVPISTRAGKISNSLKQSIRKYVFDVNKSEAKIKELIKPLVEKMESMSEEDYLILDYALKNKDKAKVNELAKKYNIAKDFEQVDALLQDIYKQAVSVGMDIGYLPDYFPRKVKYYNEFMEYVRKSEMWSDIDNALKEIDPENIMTNEERADVINKLLMGRKINGITIYKPDNIKLRTIEQIDPAINRFYADSTESLIEYVETMSKAIETAKFLGKGEEVNKSIGWYVNELIKNGQITSRNEKEVRDMLTSLVNQRGTSGIINSAKNMTYIYTMGSPISAITQIGDLALSAYKFGIFRTAKGFAKTFSQENITKEDIYIDRIMEEFKDNTVSAEGVKWVFDKIGLTALDNAFKSTSLNSAFNLFQDKVAKNDENFINEVKEIFGEEAEQTLSDIQSGNISDNVKYMLFSTIADIQPVALSEMPEFYLKGGNLRVIYMLKTYTIKMLDIYHNDVGIMMKTNPKQAIQNLVKFSAYLIAFGMGADTLKDWILGRTINIKDMFVDNLLKAGGLTKWQIYKGKEEGFLTALYTSILPPLFAPIDDLIKDSIDISTYKRGIEEARTLGRIPVGGKLYYWWFGGGKIAKERENKNKKSPKEKEREKEKLIMKRKRALKNRRNK